MTFVDRNLARILAPPRTEPDEGPVAVIKRLLQCPDCKGRGTIWNKRGPDYDCDCRVAAWKWLQQHEQAERQRHAMGNSM